MEHLSFKAGDFEGPLDALLYLISKHKMQIWDIKISDLLDQYVTLVSEFDQADLDVVSDFLEMAARLVHIKTLALLPRHEDEAERLRAELTGELIEYRLCQLVAGAMRGMISDIPAFVRQEEPMPVQEYSHRHNPALLVNALHMATGRRQQRMPPPMARFQGIVGRRIVPVSSRIRYLLRRLRQSAQLPYRELFAGGERSEQVATFIALLELIKAGRIELSDSGEHVTLSEKGKKQDE